jgi:hypothetical protein
MTDPAGSAASCRFRTIAYWVTTMIIAAELAVGGGWDILRIEYVREVLEHQLGYPAYFSIDMGAQVVELLPDFISRLAPDLQALHHYTAAGHDLDREAAARQEFHPDQGLSVCGEQDDRARFPVPGYATREVVELYFAAVGEGSTGGPEMRIAQAPDQLRRQRKLAVEASVHDRIRLETAIGRPSTAE